MDMLPPGFCCGCYQPFDGAYSASSAEPYGQRSDGLLQCFFCGHHRHPGCMDMTPRYGSHRHAYSCRRADMPRPPRTMYLHGWNLWCEVCNLHRPSRWFECTMCERWVGASCKPEWCWPSYCDHMCKDCLERQQRHEGTRYASWDVVKKRGRPPWFKSAQGRGPTATSAGFSVQGLPPYDPNRLSFADSDPEPEPTELEPEPAVKMRRSRPR